MTICSTSSAGCFWRYLAVRVKNADGRTHCQKPPISVGNQPQPRDNGSGAVMRKKPKTELVARDADRARNLVFATNIQRLMRDHGLTTRDLGSAIGMSHQGISQWLGAQNGPSNRRLAQVANFFGVTVNQLIAAPVIDPFTGGGSVSGAREMLSLKLMEDKLADAGKAHERPRLEDKSAILLAWPEPQIPIAHNASDQSEIVVIKVRDNALEPILRAGDYVFIDIGCWTVPTPGIYLLVIAGHPAWRRCHPLVGEQVLVTDNAVRQEVSVSDLVVIGRAIRWLTGP
jgi:transcriptional regulator with XRE-family HTH domain